MIILRGYVSNLILTRGYGALGILIITSKKIFIYSMVKLRAVFNSVAKAKSRIFGEAELQIKQYLFEASIKNRVILDGFTFKDLMIDAYISEV